MTSLLLWLALLCIACWCSLAQSPRATILHGEHKGDRLGSALALSANGNVLVAGFPVRVFVRERHQEWSIVQHIIDDEDASAASTTVSVAVSHDGAVVAVGSPKYNHHGRVQVYGWDKDAQRYSPLGASLHGEFRDDFFGCSVALSADGTILAVGARLSDGRTSNAINTGHVRIYQRRTSGDDWIPLGDDIHGEAAYDGSGFALSLSSDGSVVAVGSPANREYQGYVRVYQWDTASNDWHQRGETLRGENPQDLFGWSLQLSADGLVCAVGAPHHDGNGYNAGQTRVFRWQHGGWTHMGQYIRGVHEHEQSGQTVALSGDGMKLAISALDYNNSKSNAGYIRLLHWHNDAWVPSCNDLVGEAQGDRFGMALAFSADGKCLAGGARRTDRTNVGHIQIVSNLDDDDADDEQAAMLYE